MEGTLGSLMSLDERSTATPERASRITRLRTP